MEFDIKELIKEEKTKIEEVCVCVKLTFIKRSLICPPSIILNFLLN